MLLSELVGETDPRPAFGAVLDRRVAPWGVAPDQAASLLVLVR